MNKDELVKNIAELAEEIEYGDPIDWGMLSISEKDAYILMASNVLDQYLANDPTDREIIMLSTMTKLVVENFVLNVKLSQRD